MDGMDEWTDGRTDRQVTRPLVAFCNFANTPNNQTTYSLCCLHSKH